MHINKTLVVLFNLIFCLAFGQKSVRYDFKAFGVMPNVVSNELYKALSNAQTNKERSRYLDTIARVFLQSGHADSLMYYGQKLKRISDLNSNNENLNSFGLHALYYQGISAYEMGLFDEAIKFFIQGLDVSSTDRLFSNYLKLQLAQTYISKGSLDKAQALLEELPQAKINLEFYIKNAIVKSNFLLASRDYKTTKLLLNKVLAEDSKPEFIKLNLELQLGLVKAQLYEGDFKGALEKVNTVKSESLTNGFYDVYIAAAIYEGMAFANLKEYDVAEVALNSAYVNTMQWNRLELQQKVINALVQLYNVKEDYKNAYSLMTQSRAINKTIIENQNQRLVKDLEFKYETLKKEKEIDLLREDQLIKEGEISRQKTIKYAFLIGFLIILIPVILLLVVYYQKLQTQSLLNKQQEAINEQEVKSLLQSQELDLAKNAIAVQLKERDRIARELHDSIGGNLAGIKLKMNSLNANDVNFKQILNQLDATYDQVREISHSLIPKEFEVSAFTELVKKYIQNLDDDTSANLSFDAFPRDAINTLDTHLKVALFNIIKELITNAFKHAKAKDIALQITAYPEDQSLELIYEDDGVGFDLETSSKGIGLSNIDTRVKEFNGKISINTAKNRGTVISISIPQN